MNPSNLKSSTPTTINCPDGTIADSSIGCVQGPGGTINSDLNLVDLLEKIGMGIINLAIILSIIFLIKGAIQYSLSAGDDEKIQRAKRTLMWSGIGLTLSIAARLLTASVIQLTG